MTGPSRDRFDIDVAIVGYGPVGSALAILLAQYGHTVTVLERWPEPYPMPRAVHFDDEVARILQSCGIGESLDEISEPADVYEWRNADGHDARPVRQRRHGPQRMAPLVDVQPAGTRGAPRSTRR